MAVKWCARVCRCSGFKKIRYGFVCSACIDVYIYAVTVRRRIRLLKTTSKPSLLFASVLHSTLLFCLWWTVLIHSRLSFCQCAGAVEVFIWWWWWWLSALNMFVCKYLLAPTSFPLLSFLCTFWLHRSASAWWSKSGRWRGRCRCGCWDCCESGVERIQWSRQWTEFARQPALCRT